MISVNAIFYVFSIISFTMRSAAANYEYEHGHSAVLTAPQRIEVTDIVENRHEMSCNLTRVIHRCVWTDPENTAIILNEHKSDHIKGFSRWGTDKDGVCGIKLDNYRNTLGKWKCTIHYTKTLLEESPGEKTWAGAYVLVIPVDAQLIPSTENIKIAEQNEDNEESTESDKPVTNRDVIGTMMQVLTSRIIGLRDKANMVINKVKRDADHAAVGFHQFLSGIIGPISVSISLIIGIILVCCAGCYFNRRARNESEAALRQIQEMQPTTITYYPTTFSTTTANNDADKSATAKKPDLN